MNWNRSVNHHLDVNNQCTSFSGRLARSCLCGSAILYNQLLLFSPRSSCCKVKLEHPARNTQPLHSRKQQQQHHLPPPKPPHHLTTQTTSVAHQRLSMLIFFAHIGNEKQPMQRNLLMEQQVFSDSVNKATSSWIAGFFRLQGSGFTKPYATEKSWRLVLFSTKTSKPV